MTRLATARNPRTSESGFVLPLAIVLMVGVVVIAVGAMEVTLTHASYGGARLERVVATGLAEGGIDLGYQRLADDASYRGTFTATASTGEVCTVTIADVAGGLEITATSNYGSVQRGARAHLEPSGSTSGGRGSLSLARPIGIQGQIGISGGSLEVVGGEVVHGGSLTTSSGGKAVGDFQESTPDSVTIDTDLLVASAGRVVSGATLGSGTHDMENVVVQGNLGLSSPTTLTGTLLVDGHLTVSGGGTVTLGTTDAPLTLIVTGQVNVNRGVSAVEINGLCICSSRVGFWHIGTLTGQGGLFADSLEIGDVAATWTFDPALVKPPEAVSGLPLLNADVTTYAEVWRQPLIHSK
ncbi:MAG: hypothetical protein AAF488_08295 [Planctomycetota bacterium]